jgi:hypothetical protein
MLTIEKLSDRGGWEALFRADIGRLSDQLATHAGSIVCQLDL